MPSRVKGIHTESLLGPGFQGCGYKNKESMYDSMGAEESGETEWEQPVHWRKLEEEAIREPWQTKGNPPLSPASWKQKFKSSADVGQPETLRTEEEETKVVAKR